MLPGHTVSATEARIHFGELLMSAREAPVLVERQGKPVAVIMSAEHYEGLTGPDSPSWQDLSRHSRELVRDSLAGRPLPSVEDMIRAEREDRDGGDSLR